LRVTYYRCCWHVISPPLFIRYSHRSSSLIKAVYNPKIFFPHAASLGQACAHCRRFSTAATRRCIARVAVLSLGNALSRPLPVIALVGHYPTNKLIGRGPIYKRISPLLLSFYRQRPSRISSAFAELCESYRLVPTCY